MDVRSLGSRPERKSTCRSERIYSASGTRESDPFGVGEAGAHPINLTEGQIKELRNIGPLSRKIKFLLPARDMDFPRSFGKRRQQAADCGVWQGMAGDFFFDLPREGKGVRHAVLSS